MMEVSTNPLAGEPASGSRAGPGELAREQRISQNQGLVRGIAISVWRMMGESLPLDDLISYGQIGLIEAVDRYRPESGCQFSTFAYYRIRGAVLDGLCKLRGLSRRTAEKVRFSRGFHELQAERTSDGELAGKGVEQMWNAVQDSLRDGVVVFMLSQCPPSAEPVTVDDREGELLSREWAAQIHKAVSQLPAPEAEVIQKVYFDGVNLADVAQQSGYSRSWATRLHQRAIALLRLAVERYMNPPLGATVLR